MGNIKPVFVEDIQPDDQFTSVFLCQQKDSFTGKTGLPYLSLNLIDKTGSVNAKVWDRVEQLSSQFQADDYVQVRATATTYNGKLQLRVSSIKSVADSEVDPTAFLPTTDKDVEAMLADYREIMGALENKDLHRLISAFFEDEKFVTRLKRAPAAKAIHHPYLGGLLEHSLSLARLAKLVSSHYPQVDESLLLAGVFFHDIGKIRELEYERSTGYTDEGRLVGHITIGIEILNEKIRQLEDFPVDIKILLTHMILAHHGELEFGSPKRPKIVEAQVLSMIDDMDARIASFQSILDEETKQKRWTNFQRIYGRYLYRWQGPEQIDNPTSRKASKAGNERKTTPNHRPTEKPRSSGQGFGNKIRITSKTSEKQAEDTNVGNEDLPLFKNKK